MNDSPIDQPQPESNGHPAGNGALVPLNRAPAELLAPTAATDAHKSPSMQQKAVFAAFRRRWLLAISLGLLLGGMTAAIVWYVVPAPYTAFAELRMQSVRPRIFFKTNEVETEFATYKETQIRLIRGKFVLAAALREPGVSDLPLFADVPYPVEWLEENLQISSPGTEFVRISLSGDRPNDLATIVNAVYKSYLSDVVASDQTARRTRRKNLEDIHRSIEDKQRTKKKAVRDLARVLHSGDSEALTLKQQLAIESFGQLRQHHAEIQFELMRAQTQLAVKQEITPDVGTIDIPDAAIDYALAQEPAIQQLKLDVQQKEDLLTRTQAVVSSSDNPILKRYREGLDRIRNNLQVRRKELRPLVEEKIRTSLAKRSKASVAEIQRTVELLEVQEKRLRGDMETQKVEARRIGIESFELESLRQEIGQIEAVADSLSAEIQRLDIELNAKARTTKYRPADIPHTPDIARKHKLAGMAGLGVFGLIVAAIVWLEYSARRISNLDEVVDGLSLRILGSLPIMPGRMSQGQSNGKGRRHSVLRSIWMESIDATRTVLLRDARFSSTKIVMICSATGGEGKTTLSCHLATSLARSGRKTLLIDTDMRRSSLHKVFEVEQSPGFCELVRGEIELADAVRSLPTDGLFLLTAGKINQQTLKALSGEGPPSLFKAIKQEFDFIVVDSAPILPVNDSLLIGQFVDAALFSIRRDHSRYGKVATACERLAMLGIPLLGAVVIGLDGSSYGYRYPYRYYAYGGYGYNVHSDAHA